MRRRAIHSVRQNCPAKDCKEEYPTCSSFVQSRRFHPQSTLKESTSLLPFAGQSIFKQMRFKSHMTAETHLSVSSRCVSASRYPFHRFVSFNRSASPIKSSISSRNWAARTKSRAAAASFIRFRSHSMRYSIDSGFLLPYSGASSATKRAVPSMVSYFLADVGVVDCPSFLRAKFPKAPLPIALTMGWGVR